MHIEVDREKLLQQLELASRISTRHQTLPVLQCALFDVSDSTLVLRATNLELGFEARLPVETKESGVLAVPAALLAQTIGLLYDRVVTLKSEGEMLVVETSKSHTTIKTLPHDEFPVIPQLTGAVQKLSGSLFVLGIRTAAFATSQSSIKPELGSILVHQQKERTLTFVATDSFRLVEKLVPQQSISLEQSLLVPQKNALEIARITEVVGEDPEMVVSENQLALRFPSGVYVTTRLTEASFPDYQQIIPKEFATTVTVLRGDLIHALKKTNIFANTFLQVKVGIDPKKKTITFSSDSGDLGKTEETVSATIEGEAFSLSFNQRYLHDPLGSFADDSIVLKFAGVGRPMVMEGVSEKSLRYLVMPMNR
ncbi:DNA polymerase III subunit beta [Candidatus Kaiserbacteria bacterium]|nr:DNA polymerase III subunit beta [Candidatus Kaiserbacteria bacterium]